MDYPVLNKIPHGLSEIVTTFGDMSLPDFESTYIVVFPLPYPMHFGSVRVDHGRAHKLAVGNFLKALNAIKDKGLSDQVNEFGGIFNMRNIRGYSKASTHSWGIAGDFNPTEYPLGSTKRFPPVIVKCFRDAGFFYGGDFSHRLDPMHFQLCTGY